MDPDQIDLTKMGVNRTDRDFAVAWVRNYGKGRVGASRYPNNVGRGGQVGAGLIVDGDATLGLAN